MEWWYWAILIGANTPLYLLAGWAVFDNWAGFGEALRYWITPDAWSWIKGEGIEDMWAELKIFFFLVSCVVVVALEHFLLMKYVLNP